MWKVNYTNLSIPRDIKAIYFMYSATSELLYIGKTTSLKHRLVSHFDRSDNSYRLWKEEVNTIKYYSFLTKITSKQLDNIESYFINKEKPLKNKDKLNNNISILPKNIVIPELSVVNTKDLNRLKAPVQNWVVKPYGYKRDKSLIYTLRYELVDKDNKEIEELIEDKVNRTNSLLKSYHHEGSSNIARKHIRNEISPIDRFTSYLAIRNKDLIFDGNRLARDRSFEGYSKYLEVIQI